MFCLEESIVAEYGLLVKNNTGIVQIDSTSSDVGYVISYRSGNLVSQIPASAFKPEQGDLLFVKRPDTGNYYFYIRLDGSYWRFYFFDCTNTVGKVPNLASTYEGSGGWLDCVVARKQSLVPINTSNNYGLQVRDASGRTTFDSRTYTGAARRFIIETVIDGSKTKYDNDPDTDGTILTQAVNRWVCANWAYYNRSGSYETLAVFNVQNNKILCYSAVYGYESSSDGAQKKVNCPSDILIADIK